MKIVIIPDLHNKVQWIESTLSKLKYDKVIFLGDYFDHYHDTSLDIEAVSEWLKQSVHKSNRVHLFGTHDMWYRFPHNVNLIASGNAWEKETIINSILDTKEWTNLKLVHYEQGFLFSHAGVHRYLIDDYIKKNNLNIDINASSGSELVEQVIVPATNEAYLYAELGRAHPWLSAGYSRGGTQIVGGVTWLDWRYEFKPVDNLNQIVGHTQVVIPDARITKNSINYDLDTGAKYIGQLENGILTWKER